MSIPQQSYPELSTGIIAQALSAEDGTVLTNLVLQVLSVKLVIPKDPAASKEKKNYRGFITDGVDTTMALFASDCCDFFADETVDRKFSICSFYQAQIKFIANNKKIWIMAGLNFLAQPPFKIEMSEQGMNNNFNSTNESVQPMSNLSAVQPSNYNNGSNFGAPIPQGYNSFADPNANSNPNDFGNSEENITPISSINPFQNKWRIKGTLSFKSQIKNYKNAKGEGKLFNVQFMDQSGEIRAAGFNEQLDKFYPMLELNKTYYISGMKISSANKQWSTLAHDFELTFSANTEIQECFETQPSVNLYNFIKVKDIEQQEVNARIDLIAVCKEDFGLNEFVSPKTNKEFQKRDLILVDNSMCAVRLTLWGQEAVDFNHPIGSVIQGRSFRVGEFQGKNISAGSDTSYIVNPEAPEGYELKQWWHNVGQNSQFSPLSGGGSGSNEPVGSWPLHNLSEIVNRPAPEKDMPEKFSCRAMVTFFRDNATYPACPTDKCNKKLTESGSDWYCAKCDRSYPEPSYRYILSACLTDAHANMWISTFNDEAEILLNGPANEYARLQDDKFQLDSITYAATYKPYLFYCVAQSEFYNDVQRTKYVVRKIIKEDAATAAKHEIEEIKSFL